jgi:hypothetical protein
MARLEQGIPSNFRGYSRGRAAVQSPLWLDA